MRLLQCICSQGLASTRSEIHHKYNNIKWVEVCIISWAPQEWDFIELMQTLQKFRREMCLLGVRLTPKEWDLRALAVVDLGRFLGFHGTPPPLGWIYYYKESIDDRLNWGGAFDFGYLMPESIQNYAPIKVLPHLPPYRQKVGIWFKFYCQFPVIWLVNKR